MSQNQAVGQAHDEPQIEGLQPGAKLLRGQYEILRYLSNGGFGITYLARDSLDRDVVIKECFPGALCRRDDDLVKAADPAFRDDLRSIIDMFIQEARSHARLVHPNIVNVHQVFEDNQTAYMAMDLIRGCDLLDYMDDPANKTGPDFIVRVTERMLSAVAFIHESGMLHRDISPDNILIDQDGQPVLIDFGAAREQAANHSAALLTLRVVKDGYSPHEFYVRGAEQGPSSDLYVLAATLYHAISGERPIDGQTRLNAFNNSQPDPYDPLAGRFKGYPDGFLEAIDKAMEVHATDRLQSALDWLRMFRGPGVKFEKFGHRPVSAIVAVDRNQEEELSEAEKDRIRAETENAEAVVTALLAGNPDIALDTEEKAAQPQPKFEPKEEPPVAVDTVVQSSGGGNSKVLVGVAAVLVAFAAGGLFVMTNDSDKPEVAGSSAVEQPADTPAEIVVPAAEPAAGAQQSSIETAVVEIEPTPEASEAPVSIDPAATPLPVEEEAEAVVAAVPTEPAEFPSSDVPVVAVAEQPASEVIETPDIPVQPVGDAVEAAPVPAEPVDVRETQVAFSHWDVEIPFRTSIRKLPTANVVAITGVDTERDLTVVGDWIKRGSVIYNINGETVREGATLATQVLDNLKVDPDGYTRVVVRYRPVGKTRVIKGLLALPVVRNIGLENGFMFEARAGNDGNWQTVATSAAKDTVGSVVPGDVLLREDNTGDKIDGPESLDRVLEKLVAENQPTAHLTVMRNGAEHQVELPLAQE